MSMTPEQALEVGTYLAYEMTSAVVKYELTEKELRDLVELTLTTVVEKCRAKGLLSSQ